MAVSLVYMPILSFTDANANPIPFAKVFSYAAGTTTPLALYSDPGGTAPLPNPAICDAAGHLVAYATIGVAYKLNVLDANSVQVPGWPVDQIVVAANGNPTLIGGYPANVTEMRQTLDPGEVGTEQVPATLAEWMQMVQFKFKEMGRTNQWYESDALRVLHNLQLLGALVTDIPNLFPPSGVTTQYHSFLIPTGWRGQSNMTWVFDRKSSSGAGTAIMSYAINRERINQAVANIVTTTAINFTPANNFMQRVSATIPGAGLLAGDRVTITVQRDGDNAGDTDGGNILVLGSDVFYTGLAGTP